MVRKKLLLDVVKLRVIIGMLGERNEPPWWNTDFFSVSSQAFLSPVFGRTTMLAQYYGVRDAASKIHDELIGVGSQVFHLFRLPEVIEKELHDLFENEVLKEEFLVLIKDESSHIRILEDFGRPTGESANSIGPLKIGGTADVTSKSTWKKVASLYASGFKTNRKVFPYFSES